MKVLVIGGSSFIGLHFLEVAREKYDLYATYYKNSVSVEGCTTLQLDITEREKTIGLLQYIQPDVVVLCSAARSTSSSEEEVQTLNIQGVQNVVTGCRETNAKLVFISTDCVFSGEEGPYKESDTVAPIQPYGRSKVEGEKIVMTLPNSVIIRTSLVYGWPQQFQHDNFVTTLISHMKEGKEFTGYTDMYRTPTYVGDVAASIISCIYNGKEGLFHIGSTEYINMYDFATKICQQFQVPTVTLRQGLSPGGGRRPKRAGLISQQSQEQLQVQFKTVDEGLKIMAEETQDTNEKSIALVTGGCGFIGSHLVEALVQKGMHVRILDTLIKGKLESVQHLIEQGTVEFIEGDICNRDIVDRSMKGVSYVFHTAGIHIKRSVASPDDCIKNNITGAYNVFRSAHNNGVKRVIFSSSSSIYGDPRKLPMHEDDQVYPAEPYGASKQFCEHLLAHLAKEGLQYNALRYFNVYGSRQAAHAYYTTVVTHFIKRVMNGEPPTIDGKGDQSMDFTHVSDVVAANIAAMESETVNEVFNVGTGVPTTVAQLARIIIKALGKEGEIEPIFREREVYVSRRQADITKARDKLGFVATVPVEEGISAVAKEIAQNQERY